MDHLKSGPIYWSIIIDPFLPMTSICKTEKKPQFASKDRCPRLSASRSSNSRAEYRRRRITKKARTCVHLRRQLVIMIHTGNCSIRGGSLRAAWLRLHVCHIPCVSQGFSFLIRRNRYFECPNKVLWQRHLQVNKVYTWLHSTELESDNVHLAYPVQLVR